MREPEKLACSRMQFQRVLLARKLVSKIGRVGSATGWILKLYCNDLGECLSEERVDVSAPNGGQPFGQNGQKRSECPACRKRARAAGRAAKAGSTARMCKDCGQQILGDHVR
jgi:hypothetical protein